MVNQRPVKNAVIIPLNVPTKSTGTPNVTITSNIFLNFKVYFRPIVRVSTRSRPSAEMNEKITISIWLSYDVFLYAISDEVAATYGIHTFHVSTNHNITYIIWI